VIVSVDEAADGHSRPAVSAAKAILVLLDIAILPRGQLLAAERLRQALFVRKHCRLYSSRLRNL
jgi:hypothetical protein